MPELPQTITNPFKSRGNRLSNKVLMGSPLQKAKPTLDSLQTEQGIEEPNNNNSQL